MNNFLCKEPVKRGAWRKRLYPCDKVAKWKGLDGFPLCGIHARRAARMNCSPLNISNSDAESKKDEGISKQPGQSKST